MTFAALASAEATSSQAATLLRLPFGGSRAAARRRLGGLPGPESMPRPLGDTAASNLKLEP